GSRLHTGGVRGLLAGGLVALDRLLLRGLLTGGLFTLDRLLLRGLLTLRRLLRRGRGRALLLSGGRVLDSALLCGRVLHLLRGRVDSVLLVGGRQVALLVVGGRVVADGAGLSALRVSGDLVGGRLLRGGLFALNRRLALV